MDDPTIQYAHDGRWRVLIGHGAAADDYQGFVDRQNGDAGWEQFRVADRSSEGETGAPDEPEWDIHPDDRHMMRELLDLTGLDVKGELDEAGRARMSEVLRSMRRIQLPPEEAKIARANRQRTLDEIMKGISA